MSSVSLSQQRHLRVWKPNWLADKRSGPLMPGTKAEHRSACVVHKFEYAAEECTISIRQYVRGVKRAVSLRQCQLPSRFLVKA